MVTTPFSLKCHLLLASVTLTLFQYLLYLTSGSFSSLWWFLHVRSQTSMLEWTSFCSLSSSKTLYVISRLMTPASLSPTCASFWNSRYVYLIAHLIFLPRFLVAISNLKVKRQILIPSLALFHDLFLKLLLPSLIPANGICLPMPKSNCDPSLLSLFLCYLANP